MPDSLSVRELKVKGKVLLTTLLCPKTAPKKQLGLFYRERWHIELDIRHIKSTLGMDTLSCKTPEMIEKELWVYVLAYNLIRLLMAQAAMLVDLMPRQLSFKHTVQLYLAWCHRAHSDLDDDGMLLVWIAQGRVGNRPHRVEPRAIKRRPKQAALLTEPRHIARQNILWRTNPKGLK